MKWWDIGFGMEYSTKIYEYPIERPITSRRPSTAFGKRPTTSRRPSTAFGRSVGTTTKKTKKTKKTKTIEPTSLDELAKPKNPRKKITKKTPVKSTAPIINNSNLKKKKKRKNKKKKIN